MDLVGLERLFSEFLVTSILDSVHFESVRVGVHIMVLCEEITHRVEGGNDATNHTNDNLLIRDLASSEECQIFRDIMGHLGST